MGNTINWKNSLSESLQAAKSAGKKVFIDFVGAT